MSQRSMATVLAIAAVLAVAVAGIGGVAAAEPSVTCAGNGGGALFVAESNFTVADNGSAVMYNQSTFPDNQTIRIRNVTLSSNASTFLRLENATGNETCVANVSAVNDSIRIAPDGETNVSVAGNVSALSLTDADYGSGSTDLAYNASESWTITLFATGLGSGTDVNAVAGGSTIASSATDANDSLTLTLPSGNRSVDLREDTGGSGGGGGGGGGGGFFIPPDDGDSGPNISITSIDLGSSEVGVGETVSVDVRVDNDGDENGEYTGTLTANGQQVDSGSVTVNSNWHATLTLSTSFDAPGTYQLAVDGQSAGSVTVTGEPDVSVSGTSIGSSSVAAGETVTISATVENQGSAEGETTIPLLIGGEQVDERTVTVGAGETTTVTFEHTFDEPGSETVSVAGEDLGTVEVTEQSTQSGDGAASDDSGGDDGDGGDGPPLLLVGGILLVLAGGAVGGYYWHDPEGFEELLNR